MSKIQNEVNLATIHALRISYAWYDFVAAPARGEGVITVYSGTGFAIFEELFSGRK